MLIESSDQLNMQKDINIMQWQHRGGMCASYVCIKVKEITYNNMKV